MDEHEDYKCSKCGTWTVTWDTAWMTFTNRHGEEVCAKYSCSKCDEETWIQFHEDYNAPGDTIDF